jgi:hypothetical protein
VDGATRRLVLGLGGGAPALLVDLGAVVPRAVAPAAAAPAPSAPERPRRMAIEDDEDLPTSPPVRLSRRFPDELLDAMPDEPPAARRPSARPESLAEVAAALAPRKAAAHKLIDETLATRRAAGGRS